MAHTSLRNRSLLLFGLIAMLPVVGCGDSNNGTTRGAGGNQTSDNGGRNDAGTGGIYFGWGGCLASYLTIGLDVSSADDGGAISGIEATLSGPAMVTMSCEPSSNVPTVVVCRWPTYDVAAGSYSLLVTAPGFQPANVSATVTLTTSGCGCVYAGLQPSAVILDPA